MPRLRVTNLAIAAAMVLVGCGEETVSRAGFLSSYAELGADPKGRSDSLFLSASPNLGDYDKFLVEPVIVHFAPNAEGTTIDPENLSQLTSYFHERLVEALSERYQVVDSGGRGVLRVRAGITSIKEATTVLNIMPTTKLTGVGLGGASFEAEAIDSVSGERIIAVVDTSKGSQFSLEGLGALDNAKQVIRGWVEGFLARVDRGHG